jgi:V/A-type H+-transporting ATPase subunit E
MEVIVKDLLNTIKKEGVESAEKQAADIIAKAKAEAEGIVAAGKKEAESYREQAKKDAEQFESSAKSAVSQAGRDVLISVQQALQKSFDELISKSISESFSGEEMASAVAEVVKNFKIDGSLELSDSAMKSLESNIKGKLGAELKAGLELKVNKNLSGGFIIKEQGGKAYYDFSAESIAEVIKSYLSHQIAELISVGK